MSGLLGVGGAYAVSCGLILYMVENSLLDRETSTPALFLWALAGLALAFIVSVRQGKKEG